MCPPGGSQTDLLFRAQIEAESYEIGAYRLRNVSYICVNNFQLKYGSDCSHLQCQRSYFENDMSIESKRENSPDHPLPALRFPSRIDENLRVSLRSSPSKAVRIRVPVEFTLVRIVITGTEPHFRRIGDCAEIRVNRLVYTDCESVPGKLRSQGSYVR